MAIVDVKQRSDCERFLVVAPGPVILVRCVSLIVFDGFIGEHGNLVA